MTKTLSLQGVIAAVKKAGFITSASMCSRPIKVRKHLGGVRVWTEDPPEYQQKLREVLTSYATERMGQLTESPGRYDSIEFLLTAGREDVKD